MEDFSVQVSQIAHDKNENRLDDPNVVGETGNETGEEAPNNADQRATDRNHNERSETR